MFHSSAQYYDKIYSFKDYEAEAKALTTAVENLLPGTPQLTMLDVGCGTAEHHRFLPSNMAVEGFDIEQEFVAIAAAKNPNNRYFAADMEDFDQGKTYDVVTCLFSSIGYMQTIERTQRAMAAMAKHVSPGGVLIVEPWFEPDAYSAGFVDQVTVDEPGLKICRMSYSEREGDVSILNFHYSIAEEGKGMGHFDEQHRLGLFTHAQQTELMAATGLESRFVTDSGIPRGVIIGKKL